MPGLGASLLPIPSLPSSINPKLKEKLLFEKKTLWLSLSLSLSVPSCLSAGESMMMTKTTMAEGKDGLGEGGSTARTAEAVLRVVPMGLCLAALVLMLKNAQNNDFGSVSYADLTPFKYLVYANGVCVGYSLLSAFYTAIPRSNTLCRSWLLFFFDQVLTYAILAAGTVSAELTYLAYNGDEAVTWSSECGVFGSFCRRATASIGITFGAVFCYVVLSLLSSYRLFSTYEAPLPFVGGNNCKDNSAASLGLRL